MTYSRDFRAKVLFIKEKESLSFAKVAKRFGVGIASVVRWMENIESKKTRNEPTTKLDMEALKKDIELYPDAYQYERANRLNVSRMGIGHALKRLGVTYKKTLNHPRANPEKRSVFCQTLAVIEKQGRSPVFIDESGLAHDMPRTHGYAKKGYRCFGTHDWGAKGRTNVIGALLGGCLLTMSLFETTINTVIFNQWVLQDLIPKLPPESVVILDNATFHKGQEMINTLESVGHTILYLPPYLPDLNPIEKKWAQAKSRRRKLQCPVEKLFEEKYL